MKKRLLSTLLLLGLLWPQLASAQQSTLLPGTEKNDNQCEEVLGIQTDDSNYANPSDFNFYDSSHYTGLGSAEEKNEYLACAIKTGRIKLWMIPFFVSYMANFFIGVAGTVSLLFVILGGFWYMTGGVTDDKEKGKKTITYALIGLAITLLAWTIVNIVQVFVTG
jgi:hypothetical protein